MKKKLETVWSVIICTLILMLASLSSDCQNSVLGWEGIVYQHDGENFYEFAAMDDGTYIESYFPYNEWEEAKSLEGAIFLLLWNLEKRGFQHLYFNWFDNRFEVIQCKTGNIVVLSDAGKVSFGEFETFRYYMIGFLMFEASTAMYDY